MKRLLFILFLLAVCMVGYSGCHDDETMNVPNDCTYYEDSTAVCGDTPFKVY